MRVCTGHRGFACGDRGVHHGSGPRSCLPAACGLDVHAQPPGPQERCSQAEDDDPALLPRPHAVDLVCVAAVAAVHGEPADRGVRDPPRDDDGHRDQVGLPQRRPACVCRQVGGHRHFRQAYLPVGEPPASRAVSERASVAHWPHGQSRDHGQRRNFP
eukprot:Amastigsp_a841275_466.p4 type:complete len:158 gc:universal Amastigsp_a841275_466:814-341(-)